MKIYENIEFPNPVYSERFERKGNQSKNKCSGNRYKYMCGYRMVSNRSSGTEKERSKKSKR